MCTKMSVHGKKEFGVRKWIEMNKFLTSVFYRAEPLIPYLFRRVRGPAVRGIWVVHPNEFIIFQKTTLESISI